MSLARTLQVTYAGVTLGGTSGRHIDHYTIDETNPERGVFECEFVTLACTTTAAFVAECAALEVALSTPRGALVVSDGGNNLISWSHSSSTGFDGVASLSKPGGVGDTGLSRRYRFRFECGLPADSRYNTSGRRSGLVDVLYMPSNKRRVTFRGVYTALSGNGSRAQMVSAIDTYCTGQMTALGIASYQESETPVTNANDTDKVIEFQRVYDELLFKSGIFADASIIRAEMRIGREKVAPGDSNGARRLANVSAQFDCWVDKDVTTDLKSKYTSIRSTLVNQVRGALELAGICLVSDDINYDWVNNKITANLRLLGNVGSDLIECRYTKTTSNEPGTVLIPAWTGDPMSYYVTAGPSRNLITTILTKRTVGNTGSVGGGGVNLNQGGGGMFANFFGGEFATFSDPESGGGDPFSGMFGGSFGTWQESSEQQAGSASGGGAGAPGDAGAAAAPGGNAGALTPILISDVVSETPLTLGTYDEEQIFVTDKVQTTTIQMVKAIRGSAKPKQTVTGPAGMYFNR